MNGHRDVCVSAMAWTTALGNDPGLVWQRLMAGETGIAEVHSEHRLRNNLAAMVPSIALDLSPAERLFQLTTQTASRALESAGRTPGEPGTGLVLGTSYGSYLEDDPPEASAHAWAARVASEMGFADPPILVSTACSSGSDAILLGAELIRGGVLPCCLCGGADLLTESKRLAHSALGTLSPTTLRAFDVRHDGTLFGEGAAFLVLEKGPTAAPPLAFLRGAGSSSDAASMTAPDASGAAVALAIERSLMDAGLRAEDIGIVNTHASGTPLNDASEREALGAVFAGEHPPVVFGTKGNFGHCLGATGAIEAMAVILALGAGEVPPVIGLEQPDPAFRLPLACGQAVRRHARFGLSVTLGFGGFDTSLVFEVGR
jgi:3-oxoacyl-[acyl-carrier-protein] synthase II